MLFLCADDEIRQTEGFKNVNLGNVVNSAKKPGNKTNFVSKEDHDILKVWNIKSYEVKVGYGCNLQWEDLVSQ